MAHTTTSFARWRGADRGRRRQRPQTVDVFKCTLCGTIYDVMPRNPISNTDECPKCHTDTGLKATRVKD